MNYRFSIVVGGACVIAVLSACASSPERPENFSGSAGRTLCLNADPSGRRGTYQLIESALGAGAVEAPSDSVGTPARAHIVMRSDASAGSGAYFAFLAIEPDDVNLDRRPQSAGGDRSRTEIKIAPSHGLQDAFKGHEGDTFTYAWRFRIAANMRFSQHFTHLHQIKAFGGAYSDPPLITFTALADNTLVIKHVGDQHKDASISSILGQTAIDDLRGKWLDVREEITYSNVNGRYRLILRDDQGADRLRIDAGGLQMWRSGADHMRPKWGIYRKHDPQLNQHQDDIVDFANFGITRGDAPDSTCGR